MTKTVTKQEWIDALRSGKYKQGRGYLHIENEFCCLGVYADLKNYDAIFNPETDITEYVVPSLKEFEDTTEHTDSEAYMLRPADFDFPISIEDIIALTDLNDEGASFEQIADSIERNIL